MSLKPKAATHFFFEPEQLQGDICTFSREETDHILKTFRLYIGDVIKATDGTGNLYDMQLTACDARRVSARVVKQARWVNELNVEVDLAFGLPQLAKADLIVDQCTQLGVRGFLPLQTKHSTMKLTKQKVAARSERWRKVATAAVKQSLRTVLPRILSPKTISELTDEFPEYDAILLASLRGLSLQSSVLTPRARRVLLVTGPEEGFSRMEEDTLTRAGAVAVRIGERRLRAELAPVALAAIVMQYVSG